MEVIINNEKYVTQAQNLEQLINEKFPDAKGIAAAIGTSVIPRGEWPKTRLEDQASITIIRATRGG